MDIKERKTDLFNIFIKKGKPSRQDSLQNIALPNSHSTSIYLFIYIEKLLQLGTSLQSEQEKNNRVLLKSIFFEYLFSILIGKFNFSEGFLIEGDLLHYERTHCTIYHKYICTKIHILNTVSTSTITISIKSYWELGREYYVSMQTKDKTYWGCPI